MRLPGAGDAVLVLQTATSIYQVDLDTGKAILTRTLRLEQFSSFVAGQDWVIFKTVDNTTGVVVIGDQPAQPLPAGLQTNGRLYLTSNDNLWLLPEEPTDGYRTATRHGIDGRRIGTTSIRLPAEIGFPYSDQADNLMFTKAGAAYQATSTGIRPIIRPPMSGTLLGLNPNQALSWDCDQHAVCDPYLTDRHTGQRTRRHDLRTSLANLYLPGDIDDQTNTPGILSPDTTHLVVTPPSPSETQPWPVAVTDLRANRPTASRSTDRSTVLPGSLIGTNANVQYAWTPNSRYLIALTDNTIRAFDTRTGHTTDLDTLPGQQLLHLTIAGQHGR